MKRIAAGMLLAMATSLAAQQADIQETRFDRVHLRNGNFLDGQIVKSGAKEVVLKLKVGEMTLRRDLIERIEQVTMKTVAPDRKPPPPTPPPTTTTPPVSTPETKPLPTDTNVQKRVAEIFDKLRKADTDARYEIVAEFLTLGEEGALFLATQLPNFDAATMPYAAAALGRMKEAKTLPILSGHLRHAKPGVRGLSAAALASFGTTAPVGDLLSLLEDKEAFVRAAAVGAMQQLTPREAFQPVARMCSDADADIRRKAVEALFEISKKHELEQDLVATLGSVLDRTQGVPRADLLAAIGRTGKKEAWNTAIPYLRDDLPEVRSAAAVCLGSLGAPEAGDAILSALQGEREKWPRVHLAVTAEKLKVIPAVGVLIPWLNDEDNDVKTTALASLRTLTAQNFGTDVKAWQAYWDSVKPK